MEYLVPNSSRTYLLHCVLLYFCTSVLLYFGTFSAVSLLYFSTCVCHIYINAFGPLLPCSALHNVQSYFLTLMSSVDVVRSRDVRFEVKVLGERLKRGSIIPWLLLRIPSELRR